MAEEIQRELLEAVSEVLGRSVLERRSLGGEPPPILPFVRLAARAAERMEQEGATDEESLERAKGNFRTLTAEAVSAARDKNRDQPTVVDVETAMRGLCPLWPIC